MSIVFRKKLDQNRAEFDTKLLTVSYPRHPKINGYIERVNRTLEEEFIDYNLYLLSDDVNAFNSELIEYFIWYNTERPHHSLNNLSPMAFMIKYYLKPQIFWTYTMSWKIFIILYNIIISC